MYSLLCDDVRLEAGNKLSFMGVFENIFFPSFPSVLLKFAVVNHWEGNGHFETQVKILTPDRREMAISLPSKFSIEVQGYADNITFFTNVGFEQSGTYAVQTLIDNRTVAERPIYVHQVTAMPTPSGGPGVPGGPGGPGGPTGPSGGSSTVH
jgi:hypothetical protein